MRSMTGEKVSITKSLSLLHHGRTRDVEVHVVLCAEDATRKFGTQLAKTLLVLQSKMKSLYSLLWISQAVLVAHAFYSSPIRSVHSTERSSSAIGVLFKPRGRVVKDPKTGFYRPAPADDGSRRARIGTKLGQGWTSLKKVVYGTVDGVAGLPSKIRPTMQESNIYEGYNEVQRRVYESSESPGKRLMKEYANRKFVEPTPRAKSPFDSIKGAVYGTVDVASQIASTVSKAEEEPVIERDFKPVVRANLVADEQIKKSLPDLKSENPVRRAMAEQKIRKFETGDGLPESVLAVPRFFRFLKLLFFQAGDLAQKTAEELSKMPDQVSEFVDNTQRFLASIPVAIQKTIDDVKAVPDQVQQKQREVQQTIDQGVATTKKVVEDVKAIPSNLQKTVQQTQDSVKATVEAVDETVTRGKVLLGLEKAKPRPPKSKPPTPLTAKQIGWKVASGVASGAGKVAWWAGKGLAIVAWKGAQKAFEVGSEAIKEQQAKAKETTVPAAPVAKPTADVVTRAPRLSTDKPADTAKPMETKAEKPADFTTVSVKEASKTEEEVTPLVSESNAEAFGKKQADLNRQVEEALKQAEEALEMAKKQELPKNK